MKKVYICGFWAAAGTIAFVILSIIVSVWYLIPALIFIVATILLIIIVTEVRKQQLKISRRIK